MKKSRPTTPAIEAAAERVRQALEEHGVLLAHDAALPSATALIAGTPISGSWWGHAQGPLIYAALTSLEAEAIFAKLVKGKETLVHRRLWPALVSIGQSREAWQLAGLSETALAVLERSDDVVRLRADELGNLGSAETIRKVFRELELRLLVHSRSIHTDGGHHVRALSPWRVFLADNRVEAAALCDPTTAKNRFEVAISGWEGSSAAAFPWVASRRRG